ncbi:DNA cytosine methyltransferase [Peribacillus frigoritolerans]|uniref:DNA cytosine methyltransferase n=1 Tax=Peribacillus frigoritolerans TaxID=450367 RepID=UPI002E220BF3|nr:DNA cytosine methyltransferase [Peribacillus frigoritolerans]
MKVVDLFCGAGGFSEGFERAGFEIIRAYDIWGPAILTHNMNHANGKEVALKGDIYKIAWSNDEEFEKAIPDSEVIIGSPPCIAFSNSNRSGKADKSNGVALIEAFLRIVARKKFKKNSKLKYWVMENVGNSEKYVEDSYSMKDLGLEGLTDEVLKVKGSTSKLYNMKYFGVPTNRIRYICGEFPEIVETTAENDVISLGEILENLGEPSPNEFKQLDGKITDPIYGFEIPRTDLTDHHYISEIPDFEWKKAKRQKTDKGYMGRMSFPEKLDKPARTIMATLSTSSRESMIFPLGENKERYRIPTIREVATLMSFPIDFRFYGENESVKYRMVGNAVTPKFSFELAKSIYKDYKEKALKEFELEDRYSTLKNFSDNPNFINLNGNIFPLKNEKPKKLNAKYKYHVPYLIISAFRVELKNIVDIPEGTFKWDVSIHRSQGINAEVFRDIEIPKEIFTEERLYELMKLSSEISSLVNNAEELQVNYCKTINNRNGHTGPDELLQKIRDEVDKYDGDSIKLSGISRPVPYKIVIAYFILKNVIEVLNNEEKNFRRKATH